MLSIVIPIHNEEPSILPLYDRLTAVLESLQKPYEIIVVDDASTDRSFDLLANLVETDAHLKVIRLRRNFGQTAALSAGFDEAQGSVIISLDGDLQHAPEDIPALLAKIEEGYDIASGWRKERVDNAMTRKHAVAHRELADGQGVRNRAARLRHHLQGLSRRSPERHQSVRRAAPLHSGAGQLLRRAHRRGAHPQYAARLAAIRTTAWAATFNVMFDILTIKFLLKYFTRPMHFFGRLGLLGVTLGGGILGALADLQAAGTRAGQRTWSPDDRRAVCCCWPD